MKAFAVLSTILATVASEASLPIASQYLANAGLYNGYAPVAGYAAYPYAAGAPVVANAAYAPVAAYNAAPLTAYTAAPAAAPYAAGYAAPALAYATAPAVAAPAAAGAVSTQYRAGDEFGNTAFGYSNPNSARQEQGNAYGGVTGSYSYVDEAGIHTVNYVADELGYRVAADNLPVNVAYNGVAPAPVADTPEVAEAKAAFFAAYEAEVAGRAKRSAQVVLNTAAPLPYAAGVAAPAREAVLTTIKLNPGHAVFYKVE